MINQFKPSSNYLLIFFFGLTFYSYSTFASIPDDIDYEKYKNIYLSSKEISDQKRAVADQIDAEVRRLNSDISYVEVQLAEQERAIYGGQQTISRLTQEILNLEDDISSLKSQIRYAEDKRLENSLKINDIYDRQGQLRDEVHRLKLRLDRVREHKERAQKRYTQLSQLHQSKKARLEQLNRKKDGVESKVQHHKNKVAQNNKQIKKLKEDEAVSKNKIPVLNREIAQLNSELSTNKNQLTHLKKELTSSQQELGNLNKQIKQKRQIIQNKLKRIKELEASKDPKKGQKIKKLNQDIAQERQRVKQIIAGKNKVESNIKGLKQKIAQKQNNVKTLNTRVSQKIKALAKAKKNVAENSKKITPLEEELKKHNNAIPPLIKELQGITANIKKLIPEVQNTGKDAKRAKADLDEVNYRVAELKNTIEDKRDRIEHMNRRTHELKSENERLRLDIDYAQRQISSNYTHIDNLEFQISDTRALIEKAQSSSEALAQELIHLNNRKRQVEHEFADADQIARAVEDETRFKYNKYLEVLNAYNGELEVARKQGGQQGYGLGEKDGENPGEQEGLIAGQKEGYQYGKEEGLLLGYQEGLERGMSEGKSNGYNDGRNAPDNYDRGHSLGFSQGKRDAFARAHKENYFSARTERKNQLLKVVPTRFIQIDNNTAGGSPFMVAPTEVINEPGHFSLMSSPSNGSMIPMVSVTGDSWEDLLVLIEHVKSHISKIPDKAIINKDTGVVTKPVEVDMTMAICQQRYIDFVDGCLSAFKENYIQAYKKQYRYSYQQAKIKAFDIEKPKALANDLATRQLEGFEYANPIAYTYWNNVGVRDAENQGFKDGQKQGYEHFIQQARNEETQKGIADEDLYFEKNPVVRLLSVEFKNKGPKPEKIVAGSSIHLSALLANFGAKASEPGQVYVKWQALTSNIEVDDAFHTIKSIPGKTKAMVNSIAFARIKPTALMPQEAKLKVTAILPDGEEETKEVTVQIAQSFKVGLQIEVEPEVLAIGQTEKMYVRVKNESSVPPPQGLMVYLSTPKSGGLEAKTESKDFGVIEPGDRESRTFFYKVLRSAKINAELPLTITVKIGADIIAQKSVTVKIVRYKSR